MCGIAGIFAYNSGSVVEEKELLACREAMVARGPDGSGAWISPDGDIGLASRRLSIIDLTDAGAQPMATEDGSLRLVFNGEIYNYRALRSDLEARGHRFRSDSDTEVLLHLYRERGQNMVHDLRGMYAFALWDNRKNGLLLVRDPFGIKPLYYADDGSSIRFASQVKALLKTGRVDRSCQPAGHVGFFLWGYVPEPYTLYRGVRALPAGSTLWIDRSGQREVRRFWRLSDELAKAEAANGAVGRELATQRLRVALVESVQAHLVADVPVGVFLSSGLDSTTLAALASETASSRLRTVTLAFREYEGEEEDEAPLAAKVAEKYGTSHLTRWVSKDDFQTHLCHLTAAMDQPSIDGVNAYFVSKVVAETGLKVALSGLGGDELFGSYPSFRDVPRMANLPIPPRSAASLGRAFRLICAPLAKRFVSPKYAGLLEYGGSYGGAYLLRRGLFMPWELPGILGEDVAREGWRELQPLLRLEETVRGVSSDRLKVSALEMAWYMRNQLLRDADWAGMAHSLEIRVPLVDVELLRTVTPLLSSPGPLTKLDMAGTPKRPLPEDVVRRRKTGFAVPVRDWLLQAENGSDAERGLRGWARTVYALRGNGT